jgi:hypothetical protein
VSTPPAGTPPAEESSDRAKLEQKILSQVHWLLTRQMPDLAYAKQQFPVYDRESFQQSFDGSTPAERDLANRSVAAFDDAMNSLNEVLRNAYGLLHGYRRTGPAMPVVYDGLKLTRRQSSYGSTTPATISPMTTPPPKRPASLTPSTSSTT